MNAAPALVGPEGLLCVAPTLLRDIWPIVEPMLDAAYEVMDELMPPDTFDWLAARRGFLWVLVDVDKRIVAACTTSLQPARRGLACRVVACGGSKGDWERCISRIEDYARGEGCYKMKVDGRDGWGRVLSDYHPVRVSFEKGL